MASSKEPVQLMTAESFSIEIEKRVIADPICGSYIEETAALIEELQMDPSEGKEFISPTLRAKIEAEAERRGMLKERNNSTNLLTL